MCTNYNELLENKDFIFRILTWHFIHFYKMYTYVCSFVQYTYNTFVVVGFVPYKWPCLSCCSRKRNYIIFSFTLKLNNR